MATVPVDSTVAVVKGEASAVLLIVDLVLVSLIVAALVVASRRGRARRRSACAARGVSDIADIIPGGLVLQGARRPPSRRAAPRAAVGRATWSASSERSETATDPPLDAAESRGRKTAQRERVMPEVCNEESVVVDRTDYFRADGEKR